MPPRRFEDSSFWIREVSIFHCLYLRYSDRQQLQTKTHLSSATSFECLTEYGVAINVSLELPDTGS